MTSLGAAPGVSYVNAAFYDRVDEEHCRGRGRPDAPHCALPVSGFLLYEARLLEERRFDEWLDLFTDQCLYWIPATSPPTHPALSVSVSFDDRRRLEDRIVRLRTGYAYSQMPPSRVCRTLGSSECWLLSGERTIIARTPFHLSELRDGEVNIYAGVYEHVIEDPLAAPRIVQKRVHLLAADQPLKNVSFVF